MAIEATQYERVGMNMQAIRLPPTRMVTQWDSKLGYETCHVEPALERWVVRCVKGRVYVWAAQTSQWVLIQGNDLEAFTMSREEALELLNTLEPVV